VSTASRGASREHRVKRLLEGDGWAVTRGAGSHGCADLWAAKNQGKSAGYGTTLRLVQVKTDKRNPYDHFGPEERAALIALAEQTGGTAELCWWPARKQPKWIPAEVWPEARVAA
jgi:Holliday junction resolvase